MAIFRYGCHPWKIGKYTRWASCWDQYSWVAAIPEDCHICTEISKKRTIMQATVNIFFSFGLIFEQSWLFLSKQILQDADNYFWRWVYLSTAMQLRDTVVVWRCEMRLVRWKDHPEKFIAAAKIGVPLTHSLHFYDLPNQLAWQFTPNYVSWLLKRGAQLHAATTY